MSSSLEHTFAHSMESFVLMFLCLKYAYTPPIMHSAPDTSSLARTRDLILMTAQMLATKKAHPTLHNIRLLVLARNDNLALLVM